jgi:hypothetical protein
MSAVCRLFTWSGLAHAHVQDYQNQQSFHALTMLTQPYLGRAQITANTGGAQSTSAGMAPEHTKLLTVQVEPGKRVHYEITKNGSDARTADTQSPIIEGNETFPFGSGWTISLLEVT